MKNLKFLVLLFFTLFFVELVHGQSSKENVTTRILFIYDASNSMNGSWNKGKKHQIAQKLLAQSIDSLNTVPNLQLALRVYGHQKYYRNGQDCNDTKLEVPFGPNRAKQIKDKLKTIEPKGTTPIAMTLEKAGDDFPACSNCRNIIILITDGIEECGGDPCSISMKLQREGIVLKPFVIGIGLDVGFKKSFECLGTFYDASNEETFKKVLGIVLSQALNETTATVNLVDAGGKPSETDVGFTLHDHYSNRILYSYVHTFNAKGEPDTLDLETAYTYDLVVHTIPPVRKDSITLIPGKHNILGVDAPQGNLFVQAKGFVSKGDPIKVLVKKHDEQDIINVQGINETGKYITGFYDLEILTLPRIKLTDIAISQSHTTTVDIPNPGLLTVTKGSKGLAFIYEEKGNKLELVFQLSENNPRESIYLQPGDYVLLYRPSGARSTQFSTEKRFNIKAGSSASINL